MTTKFAQKMTQRELVDLRMSKTFMAKDIF